MIYVQSISFMNPSKYRVAFYSPGMVGFGHIRRNASIAQALRRSALDPVIVMLAEARQAAALPMPDGVDVVTLPALHKEANGCVKPRVLDVSNRDLIALRAEIIATAIKAFEPDVLIVDHLPRGAVRELGPTLERLRTHGHTRCVLGLRDVLQDPVTVQSTWFEQGNVEAIRGYYDAIWVYSDPAVYDPVREYGLLDPVAAKVQYTGYLDQSPRLEFRTSDTAQILAKLAECRPAGC